MRVLDLKARDIVVTLAFIASILAYLSLTGCWGRIDTKPPLAQGGTGATAGSAVQLVAAWSAGLCGIGFIASCVWAWLGGGGAAIKLIFACLTAIVACGILGWFGAHLWLFSMLVCVCGIVCLGFWAWRDHSKIEKSLGVDFDRDGKIG